ncbi:MAG: hypothetical protein JWQ27_3331 [Ferruginibacter sp.]|nr:hypothetical protein [Ferruginibacter sp.]
MLINYQTLSDDEVGIWRELGKGLTWKDQDQHCSLTVKHFITIFCLFCYSNIIGQPKIYDIPVYKNGDTSFAYILKNNEREKLGLVDLKTSPDSFHFRCWTETQTIDIWTADGVHYQGQLSNYTEKVNDPKWGKSYSEKILLDSNTIASIRDKLLECSILEIPKQDSISGWKDGLDGEEFAMEFADRNRYFFKAYWSPDFYKEIKEAIFVHNFITYLFTGLKLRSKWFAFVKKLPKGCYKAGGILMTCPKMTEKEIKGRDYN